MLQGKSSRDVPASVIGRLKVTGPEEIFTFDWFICSTVSRRRDRCRPSGRTTRLLRTRFLDEVVETHAHDHSTATSLRHIIISLGRCRATLFQVLAMVSRRALSSESSRQKWSV